MEIIIKKTLRKLNGAQLREAKTWYDRLHDHCHLIAGIYSVPYWKVAGIISALSPNNKLNRNLIDAENLIKLGASAKVCTYNENKEKALKILNAATISEVYAVFKGRKTLSFFDNIVNPQSERVTIDVWMIRVFGIQGSLTDKRYRDAEASISSYASKIGVKPMELQAMLWTAQRGSAW